MLSCTRKVGGWPQAALVASIGGQVYQADGILPALPVLERSIGVLSGRVAAAAAPAVSPGRADALLASRLAAQSFGAGDIGQFQQLMQAGTRANLAESYVAAERAYRAALTLQQKTLGRDNGNTAIPLMLIALQMSDEGRTAEADDDFAQAARLIGRADDITARPALRALQRAERHQQGRPRRRAAAAADGREGLRRPAAAGHAGRPAAAGKGTHRQLRPHRGRHPGHRRRGAARPPTSSWP